MIGIASRKGLRRCFAEAPASLMRPLLIVFADPQIEVGLQLVDCMIRLLAECDTVDLVEHGPWKRSQMPLVCGLLALVRE